MASSRAGLARIEVRAQVMARYGAVSHAAAFLKAYLPEPRRQLQLTHTGSTSKGCE